MNPLKNRNIDVLLVLVLCAVFFVVGLSGIKLAGMTWDESENFHSGDRHLAFWTSFDHRFLDPNYDLYSSLTRDMDPRGLSVAYYYRLGQVQAADSSEKSLERTIQKGALLHTETRDYFNFFLNAEPLLARIFQRSPTEQIDVRVAGSIYAPLTGYYQFNLDPPGRFFIDGQAVTFTAPRRTQPGMPVHLDRGFHDISVYYFGFKNFVKSSIAWKPPDVNVFETIPSPYLVPLPAKEAALRVTDLGVRRKVVSAMYAHTQFSNDHLLHRYPPFANTLSALTARIFSRVLNYVEARHVAILLLVLLLIPAFYYFCLHFFGRFTAASATLMLVLFPRFLGHSFNNIKDIPEAVFYTLAIVAFVYGLQKSDRKWMAASAVALGMALATKPNALFAGITIVVFYAAHYIKRYVREKRFFMPPDLIFCLAVLVPAALFVFFFLWPYLWAPLNWQLFLQKLGLYLRYMSTIGRSDRTYWTAYPFILFFYSTPSLILFFFAAGLYGIFHKMKKGFDEVGFILLVWLSVPLLRISMPGANFYDGVRHFIEYVPPLCIIAGVGARTTASWLAARLRHEKLVKAMVILVLLVCLVIPVIVYHPYETTYFNLFAGGLRGAFERLPYASDYWGSSYRAGIRWINQHAEKDARLELLTAAHLVRYNFLRKDINSPRAYVRPSARYYMYILRQYGGMIDYFERREPVYVIYRDRTPILKIFQMK